VVQGPLHALAASAAILHLERAAPGVDNVLVIGDLNVERHDELKEASITCGAAVDWTAVIDGLQIHEPAALRDALTGLAVCDVLLVRNWQPVNELALAAFPAARRVVLGDGLGVIDADRDPARPQFQLALPVIAQPKSPDSLDGVPLEMVLRTELEGAVTAARERAPGLRDLDARLADFISGGVLVLLSWLTETMTATLRAEIAQAHTLVRRATGGSNRPVVIKPHPRASLGQATALARRLRASGHPVHVMTPGDYGLYPIELFERLARAAGSIVAPGSSSATSLMYLYGVRSDVELPRGLALRTLTPRHWTVYRSACIHTDRTLDCLARWDGRSPMPAWPPFRPAIWHKVLDRLMRPLAWVRATDVPLRNPAPLPEVVPAVLSDALGAGEGPALQIHRDPTAGSIWVGGRESDQSLPDPQPLGSAPGDGEPAVAPPEDPVSRGARRLASRPPGTLAALLAAVLPSSHVPGWRLALLRRTGAPVVAGATRSAEEIEELLEAHVDVVARIPEPSAPWPQAWWRRLRWRGRRGIPAGCVAFVCRARGPSR
jgi:hypothetical protein